MFHVKQSPDVIGKMDIKQIRQDNLKILIKEFKTAVLLAEATDTNPKYISQVLNMHKTPGGKKRGMGDDLARRMEKKANKPYGWMDIQHDREKSNDETDLTIKTALIDAVTYINDHLESEFTHLSTQQKAEATYRLFTLFQDEAAKKLDSSTIKNLIINS